MKETNKTPVYKKVWFMALISVLFPIVGIFLLWKFKPTWNKVAKILLTAIASVWLLLLLFFCWAMTSDSPETTAPETTITETSEEPVTEPGTTNPVTEKETTTEKVTMEKATTTEKETTTQKATTTEKATTTKKETTTQKPTTEKQTTQKQTTTKKATTKRPETEDPDSQITVYITKTGDKYHYENPCGNGKYSPISLSDAKARGYTACEKCVLH